MKSRWVACAFGVVALWPAPSLAQQNEHTTNPPVGGSGNEAAASDRDAMMRAFITKREELIRQSKAGANLKQTFSEKYIFIQKKNELEVMNKAIVSLQAGLSKSTGEIASSVFNKSARAKVEGDKLKVVKETTATVTTTTPESAATFRPVERFGAGNSAATTTTLTMTGETQVAQGSVQDLTISARNSIQQDDPTFATAAAIVSFGKANSGASANGMPSGGSRLSNVDNNNSYNDTYSGVTSAAGGGSTSGGSYSPEMSGLWASMNKFNTSNYLDRASSYLGMGLNSYNLSSNPVYAIMQQSDNAELFRQVALNGIRGKGDSKKFVELATKDGFQDTLKTAVGEDAQQDFNLLTAGAAISSNGDFDPQVIASAQSYINGVLNSQSIISASPALASLNAALGGNGLALLSPETLNWMTFASQLAYADVSTLPSQMQNRRATYVKGYEELKAFLKNLALGDAVALLNTLRVPVDLAKNTKLYQEAHQNFIKAHNEPIKYLKTLELVGQDEQRLLAFLQRLSKWVVQVPAHDVQALGKWSKLMGENAQGTVQQWERIEPQSLTLARFFYAKMYYYAYVAQSFGQGGKASPMIILVGDAQSWANFESASVLERRKERDKIEKSEKSRPAKKSKDRYIDG